MYFLGQASNLRGQVFRHTFAFGTKKSSENLKQYLVERYKSPTEQVYLYHTGRTALAGAIKYALTLSSKKSSKKPEVAVTALTCYAVVEAVRAAGATPVFVDIEPKTAHFNGKTLEACLKKHTNVHCIVIQNNLGHPCKIKEIEKIAKKYDLPLVEDLAHCAGTFYQDGREAGTVGVATALSFGKGKSIDTTSGGALIIRGEKDATITAQIPTKKPSFADRFRDRRYPFYGMCIRGFYRIGLGRILTGVLFKLHFIKKSADAPLDFDLRLTHWQAKLALRQLKNMDKNHQPIREFYFVKDREKVLQQLEKSGYVMHDLWYETPVAPERYYKESGFKEDECPVAVRLSQEIVNLPTCYPSAKMEPARKIIKQYQIEEK